MAVQDPNDELFSVEFALNVLDRGLVVLCCFPYPPEANVRAGDPIEFVRPDGTAFRTTVRAMERVMDSRPGLLGLVLPEDVEKDQIPRGTMLRLLDAVTSEIN
jgi:hypothetical protein